MKKDLRVKGVLGEDGFEPTHFWLTKKVAKHQNNAGKGLVAGYNVYKKGVECNPKCKEATPLGTEMCIGGTCVFFPN